MFFSVWPLTFCVLVLGVAQDVCVFDSVGVLQLLSAGWRCIFAAAHRDIGKESAGVQSRPGDWRADDLHHQRVR